MKKCILVIVIILLTLKNFAQTYTIKGRVINEKGEGMLAVNVYLKDSSSYGTVTDFDGNFVSTLPLQSINYNRRIVFSFIGYKTEERIINSEESQENLIIILKESDNLLNEIKIEANKSITREFALKEFDKLSIYLSPLSSADPLKAIASLPSSTNTNETANPELRGSSSNRSKVFFNGVPINNPVRNAQINGIGFFSLINPEMIKSMQVYPSNPPLIFGNSSAGLIDIETNTKLDANQTQLTVSLASLGVNFARKMSTKSFVQLYANRLSSNMYLLVNPELKSKIQMFGSIDAGFNFHSEISESWSFNFFNYLVDEKSEVKLNLFTWPDLAKAKTKRDFSIMNFKYNYNRFTIALNLGTNFSKSQFNFGNILSSNRFHDTYLALNGKYFFNSKFKIQGGVSNSYYTVRFNNQLPVYYYALSPESPNFRMSKYLNNNQTESYLYLNLTPLKSIIIGFGERNQWSLYKGIDIPNSAYQANLRYNITHKQSILVSAGKYYNVTEPIYHQLSYKTLKSKQLSLEYQFNSKSTSINLAGYLKKESGDTTGCRYIKGTELFIEYSATRHLKASFSNTILYNDAGVFNEGSFTDLQTGYFCVGTVSYSNSEIINFAFACNWRKGKTLASFNKSRFDYNCNFYEPDFSTMSNIHLPNYCTINLSVSKLFGLFNGNAIIFGSVNNILNIKNKKSLNYSSDYSTFSFDYYQFRSVYFGILYSF